MQKLKVILLLISSSCIMTLLLAGCGGGGSASVSPIPPTTLTISAFTESVIAVNQSTTAIVTLHIPSISNWIKNVHITGSPGISVSPSDCLLTIVGNTCQVTVIGASPTTGATVSISSSGLTTVTSESLTVINQLPNWTTLGSDGWINSDNPVNAYSVTTDESDNVYASSLTNILQYNPNTQSWSTLGENPATIFVSPAVKSIFGQLYVTMPYDVIDAFLGWVWQYNQTNSSWESLLGTAPFDESGNEISSITADESHNVYVTIANVDTFNSLNTLYVWKFNSESSTWGQVANAPLDGSTVSQVTSDTASNLYAVTNNGNVFECFAHQNSWTQLGSMVLSQSNCLNAVAVDHTSNTIYAGNCAGVFKYESGTWSELGTTPQWDSNNHVDEDYAFSVDNSGNVYVYTAPWFDLFTTNSEVWRYGAAAESWVEILKYAYQINGLTIDNTNNVYVSSSNGVLKYTPDQQ